MKRAFIEKNPAGGYMVYILDNDMPFLVIYVNDFQLQAEVFKEYLDAIEKEIEREEQEREEQEKQ